MKTIYYILTILVCLFGMNACKDPFVADTIKSPNEPDTAHSAISAIVNGKVWKFTTPDTVSYGAYSRAGLLLREDPLFNYAISDHRIQRSSSSQPTFRVTLINNTNVISQEVQIPMILDGVPVPNRTILGAARKWDVFALDFTITLAKTFSIFSTIGADSLIDFSYVSSHSEESHILRSRQLPGGSMLEWFVAINVLKKTIISVEYNKFSKDIPIYEGKYSSRIERAWVRIERYDLKNWRISGKFGFRLVNVKGEIIDIENGSFENVRLVYVAES